MIFNQKQINEVMEIIDFHHIFFCVGNVSSTILKKKDLQLLKKYGVNTKNISQNFTPFQQAFYFGRLAAALRDQTGDIDYIDFKKYMQRSQYIPLSSIESKTINYLEENFYNYLTKRRDIIQRQTKSIIDNVNVMDEFSQLLSKEIKEGVENRRSVQDTVLEIGNKTQQWEIDLGRIVETETQNAYLYGKGQALIEKYGIENIRFYKNVYPGACKHCIAAYLTNGIGSAPRLFTYQELLLNGNNIGLKPKEFKPVLGTMHPFCRCDLDYITNMEEWNIETKSFENKDDIKELAAKIEGKITVKVGDKIFEI